jgi:hypothetical protein
VDEALYAELKGNTRSIAANFTTEKMADRVLGHLGLPERAGVVEAPVLAATA